MEDTVLMPVKNRQEKVFMAKICVNSRLHDQYLFLFQQEYLTMKGLEERLGRERYTRYFPQYFDCGCYAIGEYPSSPCLLMELIPGENLEQWLHGKEGAGPRRYLSSAQIRHLYSQLQEAQTLLRQAEILQLDLNPGNIMCLNECFDIRLIDFTHAYHLRNSRCPFKQIDDGFVNPALRQNPNLMLREAGVLLFTRLFFRGNEDYIHAYRDDHTFFDGYPSILYSRRNPGMINLPDASQRELFFYWNALLEEIMQL